MNGLSKALLLIFLSLAIGKAEEKIPSRTNDSTDAIARQMASVRRQLGVDDKTPKDSFFTVPWPRTGPLTPIASTVTAGCDPLATDQASKLVDAAAQANGLKPELLRALIQKESAFKPCAESSKGAQGLMQLMPETAADLGVKDPFDPKQNVEAGSRYLKQLIDRYGGDLSLALSAYNAGPTKVDAERKIPDIAETQDYVKDILGKIAEIH